jgi:hypothetical protein
MENTNLKMFKQFKDFITFDLHMNAYTNQDGEIKKCVSSLPSGWQELKKSKQSPMVYKKDEGNIKPNGIGICIDNSNLSTIDVDEPEECDILDQLKVDCKFWVKTKNGFHFYFKKENVLPRKRLCGIADINTGLLYYCPTYTHNETGEEYHYSLEKSEGLVDMPEYAIDWCKMLIKMKELSEKKSGSKNPTKKSTIEKLIIKPDLEIEKFDMKTMDDIYNILYNFQVKLPLKDKEVSYLETYEGWRDVAYIARHINNSEKSFKLFDKYCRLIPKFKNEPEINNRRAFYGKGEYNENFDENGVLIKCSKINPTKFKTTLQYLYKSKWDDALIHMNFKYIYPDDNTNDEMFNNWVKNYKCLGIRSAYGTGKTYGFKKLIEKFNFKRVLFITYRQSLAHNFSIDLSEKFGFVNYLDEGVDVRKADRLIIQLDSIKKLNGSYNYFTQEDNMPKYDLIIMDEIEGLLNHMSFDKLDQNVICDYLERLIQKAPKVLALDGDMGDRSFDFISCVCPTYKFYANDFKPNKKNFLFTHTKSYFEKCVDDDLKAKKKIVIVSMTKNDTMKYYEMYKDKYTICIHNSIIRNKEILKRANEEWAKCDLLIYSPSVEAGVDFNIVNYFDKCYAILDKQSTSYRAFCQMLNRVRYYKSDDVLCLMPFNMPYKIDEILYRFDEMRLTKYQGLEQSTLIDILIHNDTEKINSTNYFMCSLINTLTQKGHTHKYLNDLPKEIEKTGNKKVNIKEETINQIAKSSIISTEEYDYLCDQQRQNKEITIEQYYQVQKIFLSRVWKIEPEIMNIAWIEDHYNLSNMPKKFIKVNIKKEDRYEVDDSKILDNFEWKKCDKLQEIFKKIGYEVGDMKITQKTKPDFETSTQLLTDFVKDKNFKTLFNNDRTLKDINLLKVVNETLLEYGFELTKKKILGKRDEEGKQPVSYEHELKHRHQIVDYIERRKNEAETRDKRDKKLQEEYKINIEALDA